MGTRGSGAPLQRLFEDTRYLPIVTLRSNAGRTPSFYKQCSTQMVGTKATRNPSRVFLRSDPTGQSTPPAKEGRDGAVLA